MVTDSRRVHRFVESVTDASQHSWWGNWGCGGRDRGWHIVAGLAHSTPIFYLKICSFSFKTQRKEAEKALEGLHLREGV